VLAAAGAAGAPSRPVGEVTSGTFSPTLGRSIGLARLERGVQPGARVQVDIRGRPHAARVVHPPFVRRGRILIDPSTLQGDVP